MPPKRFLTACSVSIQYPFDVLSIPSWRNREPALNKRSPGRSGPRVSCGLLIALLKILTVPRFTGDAVRVAGFHNNFNPITTHVSTAPYFASARQPRVTPPPQAFRALQPHGFRRSHRRNGRSPRCNGRVTRRKRRISASMGEPHSTRRRPIAAKRLSTSAADHPL